MHVRMPLGEGCRKESLIRPYPPHTATALFKRGLRMGPSFRGRGEIADEWTLWERQVMPQIADALIAAVLLARDSPNGPLEQHRRLEASGRRYRRVLLLSPDFIVDQSGQAFLEEVNTNGFMVGDDELYQAQADTVDLMRLVGADGWPKRRLYTAQAAELVATFAEQQGYDEHDISVVRPALMSLLHEEMAAHPTGWQRIFPPPVGEGTRARLLLQQGAEYATDLDVATSAFLTWRETSAAAWQLMTRANQTSSSS